MGEGFGETDPGVSGRQKVGLIGRAAESRRLLFLLRPLVVAQPDEKAVPIVPGCCSFIVYRARAGRFLASIERSPEGPGFKVCLVHQAQHLAHVSKMLSTPLLNRLRYAGKRNSALSP